MEQGIGYDGDTQPPEVITRAMERAYLSMTDADPEDGRLAAFAAAAARRGLDTPASGGGAPRSSSRLRRPPASAQFR
jgi:hypothetical protein